VAGNPDASRSFAGRASDAPEPRELADRDGSSGSADRPRAGRDIPPPVHIRRRNRSGRGRSNCRSVPERGNAHTGTGGLALPPAQARPHMDDVGNAWNNAPACVLGTVWGTASNGTWRFRSAPCLLIGRLSPRQSASDARRHVARRAHACGYVDNARALPTYPQAQQSTTSIQFDSSERPGAQTQPVISRTSSWAAVMRHSHLGADGDSHSHLTKGPRTSSRM